MVLGINNNLQNLVANKNLSVEKNSTTQNSNSINSKQEFESLEDYTKYLGEKYGVNSGQRLISGVPTTISVASSVIKKAYDDPEEREILENHLIAMQSLDVALQTMAILAPSSEMTNAGFIIDDSGNISMYSSGRTKASWVNKGWASSLWQNSTISNEELEKILEKARLKQEEFKKDLEKSRQKQEELKAESKQNLDFSNEQNLKLNFSFEVQGKNFDELLQNFKNALSNASMLDLKA